MKSYNQFSYKSLMVPNSPWAKTAKQRAEMTMACNDASEIPRVKNAGEFTQINNTPVQIMHNGLYVKQNGYQGEWQAKIIKKLKGIHEPQEEKVFYEVLKRIDNGAKMMELGSWWSYYSMWFLKQIPDSTVFCTEPDSVNLQLGTDNMELNGFPVGKRVFFYAAASGKDDGKEIKFQNEDKTITKVPIRTVDSIIKERKISKLDILHLDIQGFETEALLGAEEAIKSNKVRFLFVSTHHYSISGDPIIHQKTIDFIVKHGGTIVSRHNILESCSGDGLIVASFDPRDKDFTVEVSLQHSDDSLFRPYEFDIDILWKLLEKEHKTVLYQDRDIESLRSELEWKSRHIDNLEAELAEIKRLPDHIKRQVKQRVKNIGAKKA